MRSIIVVSTLVTALALTASISRTAHALTLENCTTAEGNEVRAAFQFALGHRNSVWNNEVSRDECGVSASCGYDTVSSSRQANWRTEMEQTRDDHVTLRCDHRATEPDCLFGSSGTVFGFTVGTPFFGDIWDKIHICVDNIEDFASTNGLSATALMAGVISHEEMHHADGSEDHPGGASTTPANPVGAAETVGIAMEHHALSPNLLPTITSVVDLGATGAHTRKYRVNFTVENTNLLSGPAGTQALSGETRNGDSYACLFVNGAWLNFRLVAEIDGGDSRSFYIDVPLNTGGTWNVDVTADCTDMLLDIGTTDNTDSITIHN